MHVKPRGWKHIYFNLVLHCPKRSIAWTSCLISTMIHQYSNSCKLLWMGILLYKVLCNAALCVFHISLLKVALVTSFWPRYWNEGGNLEPLGEIKIYETYINGIKTNATQNLHKSGVPAQKDVLTKWVILYIFLPMLHVCVILCHLA